MPLALASAIAGAFSSSAAAQPAAESSLPNVLVTGSRFASDPAFAPIGASVISADDIRESGVTSVNEALRKIGGVSGRQSLNGSEDFALDLRGFGSTSDQNMVVLVDGVRLSESEQASAVFSAIPIESVERIEVVRGGSSVLYGEGATGGTIQVITKRPARNAGRGTLFGEVGSYNYRTMRASAARDWNGLSIDVNLGAVRTDNYRRNNALSEENFSGVLQQAFEGGRVGIRVASGTQNYRLPGGLKLSDFDADPRAASTPASYGSLDTRRYTLFAERRVGSLDFAAELSRSERTSRIEFGNFLNGYQGNVTQFSPRVRWLASSAGVRNELVAGIDHSRWDRAGFVGNTSSAVQSASATYLRDELRIGDWRLAAGVRHESFDKTYTDPTAFFGSSNSYRISQSLNAWELQSAWAVTRKAELYAKAGKSYRMPNVDDNAVVPIANQPLAPQQSRDFELGATLGDDKAKLVARIFRHDLTQEIFYNSMTFTNVNLDPTRREGFELEASGRIAASWRASASLQHVKARFTEGPSAGREMVLVPRNTASVRLNWVPGGGHSGNLALRWVDTQRFGDDMTNACSRRVPSYTVLDGRYAYRRGPWEFALTGTNLANRSYYSSAFGDPFTMGQCNGGVYPEAGRQLRASARFEF